MVPIIAEDKHRASLGVVWTYYSTPLLRTDAAGVRLGALFADLAPHIDTMCTNVYVRNPARRLYQCKGFREVRPTIFGAWPP